MLDQIEISNLAIVLIDVDSCRNVAYCRPNCRYMVRGWVSYHSHVLLRFDCLWRCDVCDVVQSLIQRHTSYSHVIINKLGSRSSDRIDRDRIGIGSRRHVSSTSNFQASANHRSLPCRVCAHLRQGLCTFFVLCICRNIYFLYSS